MKCYANLGGNQVGANKWRMTIYGNGTIEEALVNAKNEDGNLSFQNKCFNGKGIAQGSVYVNTKNIDVLLYDEENDKWGE